MLAQGTLLIDDTSIHINYGNKIKHSTLCIEMLVATTSPIRDIPHLPQVERPPIHPEVRKKVRKKPMYAFSKRELVSLACFSDEEATDNVVEWLELQGNLLD